MQRMRVTREAAHLIHSEHIAEQLDQAQVCRHLDPHCSALTGSKDLFSQSMNRCPVAAAVLVSIAWNCRVLGQVRSSPPATSTMSPGTSSEAGMTCRRPSRSAVATSACRRENTLAQHAL